MLSCETFLWQEILIIVLLICTEQLGGTRKVSLHLALSFFVLFSPRNTFLAQPSSSNKGFLSNKCSFGICAPPIRQNMKQPPLPSSPQVSQLHRFGKVTMLWCYKHFRISLVKWYAVYAVGCIQMLCLNKLSYLAVIWKKLKEHCSISAPPLKTLLTQCLFTHERRCVLKNCQGSLMKCRAGWPWDGLASHP